MGHEYTLCVGLFEVTLTETDLASLIGTPFSPLL